MHEEVYLLMKRDIFCCKNTSIIFHATIDMIFSCGSSNADRFSVTIFPIRKEYICSVKIIYVANIFADEIVIILYMLKIKFKQNQTS